MVMFFSQFQASSAEAKASKYKAGTVDDLFEIHDHLQNNRITKAGRMLERLSPTPLPDHFVGVYQDLKLAFLHVNSNKKMESGFISRAREPHKSDLKKKSKRESAASKYKIVKKVAAVAKKNPPKTKASKASKPKTPRATFTNLRSAYTSGNTTLAASLANKMSHNSHKKSCQPGWVYGQFVLGRIARSGQNRKQFFVHQKRVGDHLATARCKASHFEMRESEFEDFYLNEINWAARLYWENHDLDKSNKFAARAFKEALEWKNEAALKEAMQVLVGRVAFERHKPLESIQLIQQSKERILNAENGEEHFEDSLDWLSEKEALFHYSLKNFGACADSLKPLLEKLKNKPLDSWSKRRKVSGFAFWRAKCLASGGKAQKSELKELWDLIHKYAATSYYAMLIQSHLPELEPKKVPNFRLEESAWPLPERKNSKLKKELSGVVKALNRSSRFSKAELDHPIKKKSLLWIKSETNEQEIFLFEESQKTLRDALLVLKQNKQYFDVVLGAGRLSRFHRLDHPKGRFIIEHLYPDAYINEFKRAGQICNVDSKLLYAVSRQESLFNHLAVSHAGAQGLLQVMPSVWKKAFRNLKAAKTLKLVDDPFNVKSNSIIGACHLKEALDKYDGNVVFALAGYNAGTAAANDWIERRFRGDMELFIEFMPYAETQTYVKRITRSMHQLRKMSGRK